METTIVNLENPDCSGDSQHDGKKLLQREILKVSTSYVIFVYDRCFFVLNSNQRINLSVLCCYLSSLFDMNASIKCLLQHLNLFLVQGGILGSKEHI